MRTTYKPSNNVESTATLKEANNKVEEVQSKPKNNVVTQQPFNPDRLIQEAKVNQVKQLVNTKEYKYGSTHLNEYQDLYMNMLEANDIQKSMTTLSYTSEDIGVKKKFPTVKVILIAGALLIAGVLTYIKYKPDKEVVEEPATEEVQQEIDVLADVKADINRIYTSQDKQDTLTGISQDSLQGIYEKLQAYEQTGTDVSALKAEVDNISQYLEDKATVQSYMAVDTDLKSITTDSLAALKERTNGYIIPGLALTMSNNISLVENDINAYNALLQEMQGITDFINYDSVKYETAIAGVNHNPNKQELLDLHASYVLKQKEEQGKQELEDKAREEADKAKDKALEEANEKKKDVEKELDDTKKKLKDALDNAKNEAVSTEVPTEAPTEATESPVAQ